MRLGSAEMISILSSSYPRRDASTKTRPECVCDFDFKRCPYLTCERPVCVNTAHLSQCLVPCSDPFDSSRANVTLQVCTPIHRSTIPYLATQQLNVALYIYIYTWDILWSSGYTLRDNDTSPQVTRIFLCQIVLGSIKPLLKG